METCMTSRCEKFTIEGCRHGDLLRVAINGRRYLMRPTSMDLYTAGEIFADGVYDQIFSLLTPHEEVKAILDLGGNIGMATEYLLRTYQNAVVVTVEPDLKNMELLRLNLKEELEERRVVDVHGAFWFEDALIQFHPASNPIKVNEGYVTAGEEVSEGSVQVQGSTINRLCSYFKDDPSAIDLIKVDIEGAEEYLFKGDLSWISKTRCLAVEFHGDSRASSDFDIVMAQYGFKIFDENPHTIIAVRQL